MNSFYADGFGMYGTEFKYNTKEAPHLVEMEYDKNENSRRNFYNLTYFMDN